MFSGLHSRIAIAGPFVKCILEFHHVTPKFDSTIIIMAALRLPVNVSWGKEKFEIDWGACNSVAELKEALRARTGVPLDRQKVCCVPRRRRRGEREFPRVRAGGS